LPLYSIKCLDCGNRDEIFLKLSAFDNLPICACGAMFTRVISPVNVMADIQPYKSMVTGEMITGRSQHRAHLKRHNCFEIGNENPMHKPVQRTRHEKDALRQELHEIYDQRIRTGEKAAAPDRKISDDTVII